MKSSYFFDFLKYILTPEDTWDNYFEIPNINKLRGLIKFFFWFFISVAAGVMVGNNLT